MGDDPIFVYDITELEMVELNENNPTTSVTLVWRVPTGKLIGVKLEPKQFAALEAAMDGVRWKMAKASPPQ